jgi:hypothetical protein
MDRFTLDYGSGADPILFVGGLQDANIKVFYCLFLTAAAGTFTSVSKDNKSSRNTKQLKSRFFLSIFLLVGGRIRSWI